MLRAFAAVSYIGSNAQVAAFAKCSDQPVPAIGTPTQKPTRFPKANLRTLCRIVGGPQPPPPGARVFEVVLLFRTSFRIAYAMSDSGWNTNSFSVSSKIRSLISRMYSPFSFETVQM